MRRWPTAITLAFLLAACTSGRAVPTDDPREANGLWLLSSLEVDGELLSIDEPMFLEVSFNNVGGDTVCNDFGGEFGGPYTATAMGCEPDDDPTIDRHRVQDEMIAAILSGPQLVDDRLEFATETVHLVYERVDDPTAADLFDVLNEEGKEASPDEIYLDPEGGGQTDFDRLVRVEHPGSEARFYIGVDGELVCFVMSTDNAASTSCQSPRYAARRGWAFELLNMDGPVGVRAALIPDAFVADLETRSDLGTISENVLLVPDSTTPGVYVLEDADGNTFELDVVEST